MGIFDSSVLSSIFPTILDWLGEKPLQIVCIALIPFVPAVFAFFSEGLEKMKEHLGKILKDSFLAALVIYGPICIFAWGYCFSKNENRDKPAPQVKTGATLPKARPLTNKELVQSYIDKGDSIYARLNCLEVTDADGHLHPSEAIVKEINGWKSDLRTKLPKRYTTIFLDDGKINGKYDMATNNTHPCDSGPSAQCSVKNRMCVYIKLLEVMKAEE